MVQTIHPTTSCEARSTDRARARLAGAVAAPTAAPIAAQIAGLGGRFTQRVKRRGGSAQRHLRWLLVPLLAGCQDPTTVVRGTGPVVQERRDLVPVSEIEIRGAVDVSIRVLGGGPLDVSRPSETRVWIEGAQNLMEYVESELRGDRLILRYRGGVRLDPRPSIEVHVGQLEELSILGSGDVALTGLGAGEHPATRLAVDSKGSVDLWGTGVLEQLIVRQSGSGSIDFEDVTTTILDHTGLGSGDCAVRVTERATTDLKGSGDLVLTGPVEEVRETVAGTGRVLRPE